MAVERVFPRLRLVETLVGDIHDLLEDLADVLLARLGVAAGGRVTLAHAVRLWRHEATGMPHHSGGVVHSARAAAANQN